MQEKNHRSETNEQENVNLDTALVRAGFCGTITGGLLGTTFGILLTVYLLYKLDHFDSRRSSFFILTCLLATPTGGIAGAATGGSLAISTTAVARRAISFFQGNLNSQVNSEADESTFVYDRALE